MENTLLEGYKRTFTVPSGYTYTIREQNGADDDVLSNPSEASNGLMNISRFLAGIIVDTDYTPNRLMTAEDVHNLPVLDKWAILFNSRIHSLGNILEFEYDWGKEGGKVNYEQDLEEFLFDYNEIPSEEVLLSKKDAIPFYPNGKAFTNIEFMTSRGNHMKFDLLTTAGEAYVSNLPLEKRTKNQTLIARNLCMEVDGKWDKVTNFAMFSVKEMNEIRRAVATIDPTFYGTTQVVNPSYPDMVASVSLLSAKDFFYLEEI